MICLLLLSNDGFVLLYALSLYLNIIGTFKSSDRSCGRVLHYPAKPKFVSIEKISNRIKAR